MRMTNRWEPVYLIPILPDLHWGWGRYFDKRTLPLSDPLEMSCIREAVKAMYLGLDS